MFQFQPEKARWFSEPRRYEIQPDRVIITTDPGSDFWQRTYYGFQNDNAHVLLNSTKEPYFSFTVKASFQSSTLFDQCGLAIYQNSGSWAKACIEYHDAKESWLGSVVTNRGYSDWSTSEISSSVTRMMSVTSSFTMSYVILPGVETSQPSATVPASRWVVILPARYDASIP